MSRFHSPQAQALTEQSVQRTATRAQTYLGPATPILVSIHPRQDWPVMVDLGEVTDRNHITVGMSVEQAARLRDELSRVLLAAQFPRSA